jgi:hypothetical protein
MNKNLFKQYLEKYSEEIWTLCRLRLSKKQFKFAVKARLKDFADIYKEKKDNH